jgi:site-specific DNA-methyltransferase (adenine-specific)
VTPYYSDDLVTIYHGDCREWTGRADVLITDPPYGVGLVAKTTLGRHGPRRLGADASVTYSDDPETVRRLVSSEVPRLIGLTNRALIFTGARMLFAYPEPAAVGAVYSPAGTGRCSWGFQVSHPILFYGKDPYLADGKGSRPNGFRDDRPLEEEFDHPCPKPLAWMRWAVTRASREGESVLDPFMGTGTTLVASKSLGRRAIGIEIEERYCEIAAQRCSQEVLGLVG